MTLVREFGRAILDPVFWVMLLTGVLGALNQSTWFIVPAALLLTLKSTVSDEKWYRMAKERDKLPELWLFWLGCLGQNAAFAALAFVAGYAVRAWDIQWAFAFLAN